MLFVLASIVLIGLLFTGIGGLFGKLCGTSSIQNPWLYSWLGLCITGAVAMLISLFAPLNLWSLIVFIVLGVAGLPVWYNEYRKLTARRDPAETTIFRCAVIFSLLVLGCLLSWSLWPQTGRDTELYHAHIVRWFNEYGTAPGLGNLHTRLAFNSSWHTLAALLDNGPWDNRSEWIMPGLAAAFSLFYFFHELCFARHNGARVYALCILVWLAYITRHTAPRLYYDNPVHMVNAILVLEAWYLCTSKENSGSTDRAAAGRILILGVTAFTIKPIGAISLALSGLLVLCLLIQERTRMISVWIKIFIPAVCALGVWAARNILLSGYPLYPLPFFALPFDWTMLYEAVKTNYDGVAGWARMPGAGYMDALKNGFFFWFKPWLLRALHSKTFLIWTAAPFALSLFPWFLVIRYNRGKKNLFFLLWASLCIIYWFVVAPDTRFGDGFFWVFLALALLFLTPSKERFCISVFWKKTKLRWMFFYLWGLCVVCSLAIPVVSPGRSLLTIGTMPSLPVKLYTVESSVPFTIWIPEDETEDVCGNSPLPSAPGPVTNIEMRESGNLGKGFRISLRSN